jgi:hypothetical protein
MDTSRMHSKQDLGFFDPDIEQQNQIADHLLGMVARRDGGRFDPTKSPAWQQGWAGLALKSALKGNHSDREFHVRGRDFRLRGRSFCPDSPGTYDLPTEPLKKSSKLACQAPRGQKPSPKNP